MGNDDIVVGKNTPTRAPNAVIVEKLAERAGASAPSHPTQSPQERHCGAMSQQPCGGAVSTPQKFLHLIGCHDPNIKAAPRPRERSRMR